MHEIYKLVTSDAESRAAALKAKAGKAAAATKSAEDRKPQAGQRGIITMPPRLDNLADLCQAWEDGLCGYQKVRIYKADPALYPRDAVHRGSMRWVWHKADQGAWGKSWIC